MPGRDTSRPGHLPEETMYLDLHGVKLPLDPDIVTPLIENHMRSGSYEAREMAALARVLQVNDHVLDLGAGLGLTSCFAARAAPQGRVVAVEPNPRTKDYLAKVYALNGVSVDLVSALPVRGTAGSSAEFFDRPHVWGASIFEGGEVAGNRIEVPTISIEGLFAELRPTVISCDVEGAEFELLHGLEMQTLRVAVVELHPRLIGRDKVVALREWFASLGLEEDTSLSGRRVAVFRRL